ncbi:MAG: peptide chain release factor N(5)-glutamine methyltransferase [Acidimicrobiales bacterium]
MSAAWIWSGLPERPRAWRPVQRVAAGLLGSDAEARWLVEEAAGGPWPAVFDAPVAARSYRHLAALLERRLAGEPIQYVLGHWAFRRLDLLVDRRVLIPRPETEQVVEVALGELDGLAAPAGSTSGQGGRLVAVDLGTGSGAIALSLVAERLHVDVWAVDSSPAAVEVASANASGLAGSAATRVRVVAGWWWSALPASLAGGVHLAVSNPPYVTTAEMASLDPGVVGWEPRTALEAGAGGLEDLSAILSEAPRWLAPGGVIVIEIAPHQAAEARALATGAGLVDVDIRPDLAGRDRALVAHRPG